MKKQLFNKKRVDAEKYINTDTGETLASEHKNGITSLNVAHANFVKISSESFTIIDSSASRYLRAILSKSDLSYVRFMLEMVYGNYNILYDIHTMIPHTNNSLMNELCLARTAFSGLINRLYKKGVIYYIDGYNNKKKIRHIMLNPTIGRRTNQIQRECLKYFEDFSVKNKAI